MQVPLYYLIIICTVLQTNINLSSSESANSTHANATNNIAIQEYQVKTITAQNLSQVEVPDAEEQKKFNSDHKGVETNAIIPKKASEKTLSRKITSTATVNEISTNSSTSTQQHNLAAVAENVILKVTGSNDTLPSKIVTNVNATDNAISVASNATTIKPIKIVNVGKVGTNGADVTPKLPSTNDTSTPKTIISTTKTTAAPNRIFTTKAHTSEVNLTRAITTTTTTTTTTPKPKKPLVTYGIEDFPDLDAEVLASHSNSQSISKLPVPEAAPVRELPIMQPSQEMNYNSLSSNNNYIAPILTVLFIVPLAIGILITTYRRFKDFWSTRHYRRMDFLVDGMYND